MSALLTRDNYLRALVGLSLTNDESRLLELNYSSKNETISATQLSTEMGWNGYGAVNLRYGRFAKRIADLIGFSDFNQVYISAIVDFLKIGGEIFWKLKPEFAAALVELEIVRAKDAFNFDEIVYDSLFEGKKKTISVNSYERNKAARDRCIAYHGNRCAVCDFSFEEKYGKIAKGFIHVHHVVPLSKVGRTYKIDPILDLVPLCPNCHSVVHMLDPVMRVEDLRRLVLGN